MRWQTHLRAAAHEPRIRPMCVQCATGATTAAAAVGGVAGIRVWLAAKRLSWMTPRRMRLATMSLTVVGLIGASAGLSGT